MNTQELFDKLSTSKLLTIQDYDKINPLDRKGWAEVDAPMKEYDLKYCKILQDSLGLDIEIINSNKLGQEITKVDESEAEKIADIWIAEAREVKGGVTRKDIIRAAKLYLALKQLIDTYQADAITMASWHLAGFDNRKKITNAMPPLSWLELSKENIPCCCESLIDCLVTQMIGTYITDGYTGFVGDILNDWVDWDSALQADNPGDVVIIGHCGAPVAPHSNDRIPYTIREHVVSKEWVDSFNFDPGVTATATTVDWPADEIATIVKVNVSEKKVFVGTGTQLNGEALYQNFSNTVCRNKMVIKIDNSEIYKIITGDLKCGATEDEWKYGFRKDWGLHLVAFYGNLVNEINDFAKMAGFEVVGEQME